MTKHSLLLYALALSLAAPALALDAVPPATKAPAGLDSAKIPMLVCLGFDDNFYGDGIRWVTGTLFKDRHNPSGKGNQATFDGTPMRATFYATSDGGQKEALRQAYDMGFEIGNHTKTHQHNLSDLNYAENFQEIGQCSRFLVNDLGMPPQHIYGFRTPFLAYSVDNTSFKVLRDLGFLYDCTLDNGTQGSPKQYAYPYFPGTMEKGWIWYTTLTNPGLWQAPSAVFLAPGETIPREKGFDSNIWPKVSSGAELLGMLKSTLDWHYQGSRAPLDLGLHSDYYTGENTASAVAAFKTTYQERRQALVDFLNYAQTLPDVRIVPMVDFIRWMRRPAALDDLSRNSQYQFDGAKPGPNLLATAQASGSGLTATLSSGTLTASGSLDATGKLLAERRGEARLTPAATLAGQAGIQVTYKSSHPLHVTLVQSDLEPDKASFAFGLPSAPQSKTVTLPLSEAALEQPRYLPDGVGNKPLDLSKVTHFAFSPMLLDASAQVSFTVTDLRLFPPGTAPVSPRARKSPILGDRLRITSWSKQRLTLYVIHAGKYSLTLHTPDGKLIQSLPPRFYDAGYQTLPTPRVREGFYVARISTPTFTRTQHLYAR